MTTGSLMVAGATSDGVLTRFAPGATISFPATRQTPFDLLADAVANRLDSGRLRRLIEHEPPASLPATGTGL